MRENNKIISAELTIEDCAQLPYLIDKIWKRKTSENYWYWKFYRYPFENRAIVFKNSDGIIVGLSAFWLRSTKLGNKTITPFMAIDIMADPEYRGRVISEQIVNWFFTELRQKEILFGFTNPISHKIFSRYLEKFMTIDTYLPLFICVFNIGTYMKSPKLIQSLATNISRCIHKFRLCFNGNEKIMVKKSQDIGEEFNQLWKDVREEYFWIQNREKDYLQWRYLLAPHRKYQIWKATEEDRLVGYLVTTIKHDSRGHRGFLVDWLVSRKRVDVFKAMIKSALEWLINQKVYVLETLVLNHEKQWKDILKSHFFIKIKRTQSFLLAGLNELKTEDLFLTIGDSDQI